MKKHLIYALSLVPLAAACGSGGGGGETAPVDASPDVGELNRILEQVGAPALRTEGPDFASIPTGEVQYEGASYIEWTNELGGQTGIRGAVEITADLAANDVSGEIYAFGSASRDDGARYDGVLTIAGASLVDEADYMQHDGSTRNALDPFPVNLAGGTVTGTLTTPEDTDIVFETTTFEADFRGDAGQYIFGQIRGDITDNGFVTTLDNGVVVVENDTTILP